MIVYCASFLMLDRKRSSSSIIGWFIKFFDSSPSFIFNSLVIYFCHSRMSTGSTTLSSFFDEESSRLKRMSLSLSYSLGWF